MVTLITFFLLATYFIFGIRRMLIGGSRPIVYVPLRIVLVAGLLYLVWRGHHWARTVLGILLLLTFLAGLSEMVSLHPLFILDTILRAACGVLLLFSPSIRAFVTYRNTKYT